LSQEDTVLVIVHKGSPQKRRQSKVGRIHETNEF